MKKTILFLLLLPLLAAAQKPAGRLTPYADATFENGKIIYTVSRAEIRNNPRLLPLMLPKNLVSLRTDNRAGTVSGKYMAESQRKIRDYLATEPVALRGTQEQSQYLRLAAMAVRTGPTQSSGPPGYCCQSRRTTAQRPPGPRSSGTSTARPCACLDSLWVPATFL